MQLALWFFVLASAVQEKEHVAAPFLGGPAATPQSSADLTPRERRVLARFARLQAPSPEPTNRWSQDPRAIELGRALFFDSALSEPGTISCATCHDPEQGWCDGKRVATGVATGVRNTPSVINAAHSPWQFWDGRADSLWAQVLGPLENPAEMNGSRLDAVTHVASKPELRSLYEAIFPALPKSWGAERFPPGARPAPIDPKDPFAEPSEAQLQDPRIAAWAMMDPEDRELVNRAAVHLAKSLAAFERTLVSGEAPIDRLGAALRGEPGGDPDALSNQALHGWRLFVGKAGCVSCHFGPTFSDGRFHNLGLPDEQATSEVRIEGIRRVRVDPLNGRGRYSDDQDWQSNTKLLYVNPSEHVLGAFKTPTLRDVSRTAPYMHDGRFATLEDVVRFYSEMPEGTWIGHREETLQPLHLSRTEIRALVAFLQSLTGPEVSAR